jgi:hypothetical protein
VSFAAQHGSKSGFSGWRIMMVAVGAFNACIAVIVLLFLPSTLDSAQFLSAAETQVLRRMLILDQAGNGTKVFQIKGLKDVFLDLQVWLLTLLITLILLPNGVITTFSSLLIRNFGYTSKEAALLNMPSGVVSIISTFGATYAVLQGVPRWICIIVLQIPAFIGAGLMSFLPQSNQAGKLAGIYLINTMVAPAAILFSWVGANTSGYTKRIGANAMIAAGFAISNIIGPQTFQAKDAPNYLPAKITVFVVAGANAVVAVLLKVLYTRRNASTKKIRDAQLAALAVEPEQEQGQPEDPTDRANPAFIYVY